MAESFFATLQTELLDHEFGGRFPDRHTAKLAIFDWLEAFYNRHSFSSSFAGDSRRTDATRVAAGARGTRSGEKVVRDLAGRIADRDARLDRR